MKCTDCNSYPCEKVGTSCYNAIHKDERDKVLEELEKQVSAYRFSDYDRQQLILTILSLINEIREVGAVEDV
jgi:DNA polymerase II large subunit